MSRIQSKNYGIVHCLASCRECDWECGIHSDGILTPEELRNEVRKHIRKTKHRVHVETGTNIDYFALND